MMSARTGAEGGTAVRIDARCSALAATAVLSPASSMSPAARTAGWFESVRVRVSVAAGGAQGNGDSFRADVSADGRFVAFDSAASNLVAGNTNGTSDVFVRDLAQGVTRRVSLGARGKQLATRNVGASISADGRVVVFSAGAAEEGTQVYVRDRVARVTRLVSVALDGTPADGEVSLGKIFADGRFVAFQSSASNLVRGDTNATEDAFLRDVLAGTTERMSISTTGLQANAFSRGISISADGRHVAFGSPASNLVARDTNRVDDVFVRSAFGDG